MLVIGARNVHEALPLGLDLLASNGIPMPSRAGNVITSPVPVTTVYREPCERVLFWPERDANPFFHFFEGLWMLAGRNDLKFLTDFVKRFEQFSNDGKTVSGAYGFRWRQHWREGVVVAGGQAQAQPIDQIERVVALLSAQPFSRRAVLTMFDPIEDLRTDESNKDIPCFAGETLIWSPEGNLTIRELASKFQNGEVTRWPVYGVTEDTKEVKLTWCTKVWHSGTRRLVKITFDDGTVLRVTPDHILYKRKRSAIKAQPEQAGELRPGDRVLATKLWVDAKGYLYHKRLLGLNTAFSNRRKIHIEYSELLDGAVPAGIDVHHGNENKQDNRLLNLERLPHGKHAALNMLGERNPSNRMTDGQRAARGAKHSVSLAASWAGLTPEERKLRAKGLSKIDNHVVVSVEPCEAEEVFDFEVPDIHTALVGSGVVAHNCNTQAYFMVGYGRRDEPNRLHLTVTCRSNDIIWGAYGANAVHFSMMHEYMAARLGLAVGNYYQMSNNYHAYEDVFIKTRHGALAAGGSGQLNPYVSDNEGNRVAPFPMVENPRTWDRDLALFFEDPTSNGFDNPFFGQVVKPLWWAHVAAKRHQYVNALEIVEQCRASDWRRAAEEWLQRRKTAWQAKKKTELAAEAQAAE